MCKPLSAGRIFGKAGQQTSRNCVWLPLTAVRLPGPDAMRHHPLCAKVCMHVTWLGIVDWLDQKDAVASIDLLDVHWVQMCQPETELNPDSVAVQRDGFFYTLMAPTNKRFEYGRTGDSLSQNRIGTLQSFWHVLK